MGFLKGFLDGIYLGFGLVFGIIWIFIKLIPWWIWTIFVLVIFLSWVGFLPFSVKDIISFLLPRRRYYSRTNRANTYIDENGYERFSDSDKLVSRWKAEKKLGRKLYPEEVVHHKNEDKLDNRASNLEVLPDQEEHDEIHGYDNDEDDDDDDDLY